MFAEVLIGVVIFVLGFVLGIGFSQLIDRLNSVHVKIKPEDKYVQLEVHVLSNFSSEDKTKEDMPGNSNTSEVHLKEVIPKELSVKTLIF